MCAWLRSWRNDFCSFILDLLKACEVTEDSNSSEDPELVALVEGMIAERKEAKKAKDFAKADEIRAKLLDMGIALEDTREGVKWKRV